MKKEPTKFVCKHCGIGIDLFRGTWRHLLNGATGGFPPSRRHKAEPIEREVYEAPAKQFVKDMQESFGPRFERIAEAFVGRKPR